MIKNRVKIIRVEEGLQQKQLASKVGISRQTLSLIEKYDYNPSLKLCLSLAQHLNTDLDTLFGQNLQKNNK